MRRPPHLPAAVIVDQDAPVARVVPKGAKLKRVGKAVLGYHHKPARIAGSSTPWSFERQRLSEIEAVVEHRHNGPCDTDDGEAYLRAALPHILVEARQPGTPMHRTNAILWANRWTPRILDEVTLDWLNELEHEFATRPRLIRADTLAKMLGVTKAERDALGLTTIGATDWNRRQRVAARKRLHAERQKQARAKASGYKPRDKAASKIKPWIEAGFRSRRTWERHGKPELVANSCASFGEQNRPDDASSCAPIELRSSWARDCDTASISAWAPISPAQPVDARQLSLLPPVQASDELRAALEGWHSGPIPDPVRVAYVAAKRRRAVRQVDVAEAIGLSRPQLANGLSGTFGLSEAAASRLKAWILADDRMFPPASGDDQDRPARPHHRRGGRRPPHPGPALPSLRLFAVVPGMSRPAPETAFRIAA